MSFDRRNALPVVFYGAMANLLFANALLAGTILQPASVIVQAPLTQNQPAENLINQSGLSTNYTTLLDDFDAFIALTPTHADRRTGKWQSDTEFKLPGNIDFDLGGTFDVSSLALWNTDDRNGVGAFTLLIADDPAFSEPTVLGSFAAAQVLTPQVYSFPETTGSHLRMTITAADGDRIRIGEVAFEVVPRAPLGDINADGIVNFPDFLILSGNFGQDVETGTAGDLNRDGTVSFPDFLILSDHFGQRTAFAVAEPSGLLMLVLAITSIGRQTIIVRFATRSKRCR